MSGHIQEDRAHTANNMSKDGAGRARLSRRQLLRGAGGLAAMATFTSGSGSVTRALTRGSDDRSVRSFPHRSGGAVRTFHSRPDLLPPAVAVSGVDAAGYLLLGPGSLTGFYVERDRLGTVRKALLPKHAKERKRRDADGSSCRWPVWRSFPYGTLTLSDAANPTPVWRTTIRSFRQ